MAENKQTQDVAMSPKMRNFLTRLLSGSILFPIALYAFYSGGILFFIAMLVILWVLGYEWSNVCGRWPFSIDGMTLVIFLVCVAVSAQMGSMITAFITLILGMISVFFVTRVRSRVERRPLVPAHINRIRLMVFAMGYFGLFAMFFPYLRTLDPLGMQTIMWVFCVVVASDTMGYLAGMSIGGPKLIPSISPNKTWSGLMGSIVGVAVVSYFFGLGIESIRILPLIIISPLIAIISTAGDIVESKLKRHIGVKDISNIIPGHGGMFDRLDALILTSIFVGIFSLLLGNSILLLQF